MRKVTFALYFGNRGFFPGELIATAREEMRKACEAQNFSVIMMDEKATRNSGVETVEEGRLYAKFLEDHRGEYDGVILSLPNFGDENGAVAALRDCNVPILLQAYPDEIGLMNFSHRRDAFCGKFSIMDVFTQYNIPFTNFGSQTVHPLSSEFAEILLQFAAVCRVVKGMKRFTVGAIGARTTAFKTVRFDELALQKYGITTETLDLSDLMSRARAIDEKSPDLEKKKAHLTEYTNFSRVPADKADLLSRLGCALDDVVKEYNLDAFALRCWNELQLEMGIAPCVLLSEMNDRGIVGACEMDVCNAVPMRALSLASEEPSTVLDWNNNYGDDPDKCILFHCGPVPQSLMTGKGMVTDHAMFAKSYGAGSGWGTNEGRIAAFPMTFCSSKTEDGRLTFYLGEGEFTEDQIEKGFFGCGGVAHISGLQDKLRLIGKNGYRHHVSVTRGRVAHALREAFTTYLKYEIFEI